MYRLSNTFPTVYFFQEEDSLHGGDSKFLGGDFLFSTWARKNSSEESNETSEESNDKSEEFFFASVENKNFGIPYVEALLFIL